MMQHGEILNQISETMRSRNQDVADQIVPAPVDTAVLGTLSPPEQAVRREPRRKKIVEAPPEPIGGTT